MPPKKKSKLSREEILERKRVAERLRYERLKNDNEKREQMREKERQKYQAKKEKGTRKLAKDMNRREHNAAKKAWKGYCTTYRAKKKALKEITNNFVRENTPDSEIEHPAPQRPPVNALNNARKARAKKMRDRISRDKDRKIAQYQMKVEKYRKRLQRLEKASTAKSKVDTPNTKLQKMCDTPEARKDVIKKALFGEVINEQLKENYANLKTFKEKQIFGKVLSGKLVDKYKLWRSNESIISYKRTQKSARQSTLVPAKQTRGDRVSDTSVTTVRKFYEDDDNSRIGAGKRECVTRKGVKKQKRYLSDSISNLHKKFKVENFNISYQTFCRLRPFWVVTPKVNERDTCLCITHANVDLKLAALHSTKMLPYYSHAKLLENICCNRYDEQCLSRECQRCFNKNPDYKEFDDSKPLQFKKWVAEKQDFQDSKSKKTRTVTKYLKRTFTVHPRQLIENLQEDLDKYLLHERNIIHQYKAIKDIKENLCDEGAIIHMDFSENYCTKYNEEIQAYHFGGSRLQLSLHTVVVYMKGSTQSYCTVSKNTSHSPGAIWAHLQPILRSLPPHITSIHFVSDGPVTQYRNKTMFFILASRLHLLIPSVETFSWNYSESGHGKGAPDGVGATCKRTADSVVAAGGDIDSLESFVETIQQRCPGIVMITIDDDRIQKMIDDIQKHVPKLKSFTGTLKVHQIKGKVSKGPLRLQRGPVKLIMKSLSCACVDECQHFNLGAVKYEGQVKLNVEDVFTDSECENETRHEPNPQDHASIIGTETLYDVPCESKSNTELENVAGPSSISVSQYNTGDYVLVKFPVKNMEYRYIGVINQIDNEEGVFTITFLKICDRKGHTFRVDETDVSDVAFDQILEKLPNPDLTLKGKRIFYYFKLSVPVFEK